MPASDPRDSEFTAALAAGIAMNIIETVVRIWVENPDGTKVQDLARRAMTLLRGGGIPLPQPRPLRRSAARARENSRYGS